MLIPNSSFIENLRDDFRKDVNRIFDNQVVILTEEEMFESLLGQANDVIGRYPHSIIR